MSFPTCVMLLPLLFPAARNDDRKPSAPPVAPAIGKGADGGDDAARSKKGEEALADAARIKRSAAGKKDAEKLELMNKAAATYEQVAKEFAADADVAAEASFRAGEIYRTVKRIEDAGRCFNSAATSKTTPEWSARGWLELGHIARRLHKYDEAFKTYGRVLEVAPQQRSQSVDALTWQGRVLIEQKQEAEGHALLLSIGARFPDFPVDDIRNVDDVAVDWIRAGRIDEASKLVLDCVERHGKPNDQGKEPGEAVRRALDHMKARELLAAPPKEKESKEK
jgi:tetratricopeptide (TPR) repeat protein